MNLKRLWDTENKEMVWAIPTWDPHKKLQVWTNDDWSKLYVYDMAQYLELDTANVTVSEYGPVWKTLDDQMVGYYLTNVPTELYNWDEWDEVSYTFKDYDGTVLKTGKVDEGTAPTPPADPTREATAQYTYTFAWWNPEVWAISKRTTYTATYTASPRNYTVTIEPNDDTMGSVTTESVVVAYGTAISASWTGLTIWWAECTATAEEWYVFVNYNVAWESLPETVTEDLEITATFEADIPVYNFTCVVDGGVWGTVSPQTLQLPEWTVVDDDTTNVLVLKDDNDNTYTVTATASEWYVFNDWYTWIDTVWVEDDGEIIAFFRLNE